VQMKMSAIKKKKKQGIVQFPPGKIGDLKQN
jgi:hypothetical protein